MASPSPLSPAAPPLGARPQEDRRLLVQGVDWRTYVVTREMLDSPGLRMTYLEGALELMTPSRRHERIKTTIARLLEVFALERGVPLQGYGSTTCRREEGERGLEGDECYTVGRVMPDGGAPDLALEVVLTRPLLDKLEVYRGLGVAEVWVWAEAGFRLFALRGDGREARYEEIAASELVPGLDFGVLAEYSEREDQHAAVLEYRQRLRAE